MKIMTETCAWRILAQCRARLLVCYRTDQQPSKQLFKDILEAKKFLNEECEYLNP